MRNAANVSTFNGARIAGVATYTPNHIMPGGQKPNGAKAEFNIFQNAGKKKFVFRITAWGKMADVIARSGSVGKEVSIIASVGSYEARVWLINPDGSRQFVTKPDGNPLLTTKVGFTIQSLTFGADSAKTIADEIALGKRPANWNAAGHADQVAWKNLCATKNAEQYVPGAVTFGLANVFLPPGAQIVQPQVVNNTATGTAQFAGNTIAVGAAIPGQVPIIPPQNVMVNGQNMGYAMPPAQTVVPITPIPQTGAFSAPVM